MTNDNIERLLDNFPLRPEELESLLQIYERYGTIDESTDLSELFLDTIDQHWFRRALSNVYCIQVDSIEPKLAQFLETCVSLIGRRNSKFLLQTFFESAESPNQLATVIWQRTVVNTNRTVSTIEQRKPPDAWISTLNVASYSKFYESIQKTAPKLAGILAAHVTRILLPSTHAAIHWPPLPTSAPLSIQAQLALLDLPPTWNNLYFSDRDGLAFPIFWKALSSFPGPTLILVQTTLNEWMGYYTQLPWKESSSWYGSDEHDAFLMALAPQWEIFPLQGGSTKYMQQARKSGGRQQWSGLRVGGVACDAPRWYIPESLEKCQANTVDSVFSEGALCPNLFFDVLCLQVWAITETSQDYDRFAQNGDDARSIKELARQRVARVDRTKFLEDFESGGTILSKLFEHRDEARGRADFVAAENQEQGYFLEGKLPSPKIREHKQYLQE